MALRLVQQKIGLSDALYNESHRVYNSQTDKVQAMMHQRRLDKFVLLTEQKKVPFSRDETLKYVSM